MAKRALLTVVVAATAVGGYVWFEDRYPSDLGIGCDADAGPTALVAFRGGTGELVWTANVGSHQSVEIRDGIVHVDAIRRRTRLEVTTGRQLSCVDLPEPPIVDRPAATDRPEFRIRGESAQWRIETAFHESGSQRQRIIATALPAEVVAWDAVVPALDVQLVDDLIVIIDQTGDDGVYDPYEHADTKVAVYEPDTGDRRWRVAVPLAPHFVAGTADGVAVPIGTAVLLLDWESGEPLWLEDHGSPGRGGQYSANGQVRDLVYDEVNDLIIAAVQAERPYRD